MITESAPSPFRRLRQPLNVTVVGDFGLTDGVAVWVDDTTIEFVVRERLSDAQPQLVRLDLGGLGENVDLEVRLLRVIDGRQTPFRKGWFHGGRWKAVSAKGEELLDDFLGREHSQVSRVQTLVSEVDPSDSVTRPTQSSLVRSLSSRPTDSRVRGGEQSGRQRVRRSMRRARKALDRERRAEFSETSPTGRRAVAQRDLVTPAVSMAGGISVMASFDDADALESALKVRGDCFRLVLERVGRLHQGDPVQLVLRLPDGSFLQTPAVVRRLGPTRIQFEAQDVDGANMAILQRARDQTS